MVQVDLPGKIFLLSKSNRIAWNSNIRKRIGEVRRSVAKDRPSVVKRSVAKELLSMVKHRIGKAERSLSLQKPSVVKSSHGMAEHG